MIYAHAKELELLIKYLIYRSTPNSQQANHLQRVIVILLRSLVSTLLYLAAEKVTERRELSTICSYLILVSKYYINILSFILQYLEKQTWYQPKIDKMKLPQPRMGHSSQVWNGSQIIIYGGWNGF